MLPRSQIRQIDYIVIFARNMDAMRDFYETIMEFPLLRALSDRWIEYRCPNTRESLQCGSARPIRASLSSKACRATANFDRFESHPTVVTGLVPATPER